MSERRRFIGWGVFLVCLGGIPLAARFGLIDVHGAAGLLRLWPLILVGIGISLVLRWTPYRVVGSVVAGAITGIVVGVAVAGGITSPAVACTGGDSTATPVMRTGTFSGPTAQIDARWTCGHLTIARGTGSDWSLAVATAGAMPLITSDAGSVDVRSATSAGFMALGGTDEQWQLTLPAQT